MTVVSPAYRLTLYAPKSVDTTERTALTPASGAPHTDPFKVASVQGVTGYQPYLITPQGMSGRFDPKGGGYDIGNLTFPLVDMHLDSGNLNRWVTAFTGDGFGKPNLKGRRVAVEVSRDWDTSINSGSWQPFFEGRVKTFQMDNLVRFKLVVADAAEDLKLPCFVGRPHVYATGSVVQTLLPVGLSNTYGPYAPVSPLTGTVSTAGGSYSTFTLDVASVSNINNTISDSVRFIRPELGGPDVIGFGERITVVRTTDLDSDAFGAMRLRITSASVAGEFGIAAMNTKPVNDVDRLTSVDFTPLLGSDPSALPLSAFANGSTASVQLMPANVTVDADHPVMINDIHPFALFRDLLNGYYGYLTNGSGTPLKALPYDDTAFSALIADTTFKTCRFVITKPDTIKTFVQNQLTPFGVGYRVEHRYLLGSVASYIVPFDNRLPASLTGIPTLTNADVATMADSKWDVGTPLSQVGVKFYADSYKPYTGVFGTADVSALHGAVTTIDGASYQLLPDNLTADGTPLIYDVQGCRFILGDVNTYKAFNDAADDARKAIMSNAISRFGNGGAVAVLNCARTTTVNALDVGNWVLVNVDALPNSTTHTRGGQRLMQVVEKTDMGEKVTLRLFDSSQNTTAVAPTVTAPVAATGIANALSVNVTGEGTQVIHLRVAQTAVGAAAPSANDPKWRSTILKPWDVTGTKTLTVDQLQANTRFHVQVRTESSRGELASAWVYAGFYDQAALAAPTSLVVSNITPVSATLTWSNNGDTTSAIAVYGATPSTGPLQLLTTLRPQSTTLSLYNLVSDASANPYLISIKHVDLYGGASTAITTTFTATGTTPTCPSVINFY